MKPKETAELLKAYALSEFKPHEVVFNVLSVPGYRVQITSQDLIDLSNFILSHANETTTDVH